MKNLKKINHNENILESSVLLICVCGEAIFQVNQSENPESILCQECAKNEKVKKQEEVKKSCEKFDDLLRKIELLLQDPYNFTYELVTHLKNEVQLKGEEEIFQINEKMHRVINKLDEFNSECKNGFTGVEYLKRSNNLRLEKETGRLELEKWITTLDKMKKEDDKKWKRIESESGKAIKCFENKLNAFKFDLFPKSFMQFRDEIENDFGQFKIDLNFEFG
jgi:hypothetical protein